MADFLPLAYVFGGLGAAANWDQQAALGLFSVLGLQGGVAVVSQAIAKRYQWRVEGVTFNISATNRRLQEISRQTGVSIDAVIEEAQYIFESFKIKARFDAGRLTRVAPNFGARFYLLVFSWVFAMFALSLKALFGVT